MKPLISSCVPSSENDSRIDSASWSVVAPSSQAATLAAISRALTITKPTFAGEISNPAMGDHPRWPMTARVKACPTWRTAARRLNRRLSGPVQTCHGLGNDLLEHGCGQPPGIGVLAGAMIAVEQDKPARKRVPGAVGEGEIALLQLKRIQDGIMGDAADRQERGEIGQCGDTADQECAASGNLLWLRLVQGRHAAHCIRDHAVDQLKLIGRGGIVTPACQPQLEKRAVEKLAGMVAEKGTSRAVGALQTRRESNNEESRG